MDCSDGGGMNEGPAGMDDVFLEAGGLRAEIAASAAALIAEDGLDYVTAKRKAYERLTGGRGSRIAKEMLPSNEQVENALREYQALFQADSQPQRLLELRTKALALMELLQAFEPTVVGAIANGTAGDHSDIHLHCVADSAKALGIFLLNHHLNSEAAMLPNMRAGGPDVEALALQWQGELAVVAVYPHRDGRSSRRNDNNGKSHMARLDIPALAQRIAQSQG